MKYYKTTVIEDTDLFNGITAYRLAKIMGVRQSYISKVKNNKHVVSEQQYLRLRRIKEEFLAKQNNTSA